MRRIKPRYSWVGWRFCGVCLGTFLLIVCCHQSAVSVPPELLEQFPALRSHSLPETLVKDLDIDGGDYFADVEPSVLGYLIWSDFPVSVYFDPIDNLASSSVQVRQSQWQGAITQAIAQWNEYIPLETVPEAEAADIVFRRQAPAAQRLVDPETGHVSFSLGRNAVTSYDFYFDEQQVLRHRMQILLGNHQGAAATFNTARHELGHALGIWGHSSHPDDALFSAQTSLDTNGISAADINTLRRIYQQPTRLGWPIPQVDSVPAKDDENTA